MKRTRRRVPPEVRFWAKVDKSGGGCWLWQGYRNKARGGYGQLFLDAERGSTYAHRFSWELANGRPVPAGLDVMHSCDNPPCVNPAHLSVGTRAENLRDMLAKGRGSKFHSSKTHCPQGHPYDDKNTIVVAAGSRQCRACKRVADLARFNRRGRLVRAGVCDICGERRSYLSRHMNTVHKAAS